MKDRMLNAARPRSNAPKIRAISNIARIEKAGVAITSQPVTIPEFRVSQLYTPS
jgi:hypothetical protein